MDDIARHRPLKPSGKRNKMPISVTIVELTGGLTMILGVVVVGVSVALWLSGDAFIGPFWLAASGVGALVSGAMTLAFAHLAKAVIEIRDMARARL